MKNPTLLLLIAVAAVLTLLVLGTVESGAQDSAVDPQAKPADETHEADSALKLSGGFSSRPAHELTDQEKTETLDFVRRFWPDRYERLIALKEINPGHYEEVLQTYWRWADRYKSMPEDVQKAAITIAESETRIGQLLQAYKSAAASERPGIEARIAEVVAAQFDAQQTYNQYRLERLEKLIEGLRADLKQQAADRDRIIVERTKLFVGGAATDKGEPASPAGGDAE